MFTIAFQFSTFVKFFYDNLIPMGFTLSFVAIVVVVVGGGGGGGGGGGLFCFGLATLSFKIFCNITCHHGCTHNFIVFSYLV